MPKRCKNCKQIFKARFKTTERYCWDPECKTIEAMQIVQQKREQQAKQREKVNKAIKEKKERDSLATLRNNVKNVCHEYIRLRDTGKPCVSCGGEWKDDHEAGHWYSAKQYSSIRFDERNIHGQCIGCNRFLKGNVERYTERVHLRIGEHGKAAVQKAAAKYKQDSFKWERSKLVAIRKYYQEKIKSLKKDRE